MPKELFRIGGIQFYDDEIESLSNLKKNRFPRCGKALLDFRDDIIRMAEDLHKISGYSRGVLIHEMEMLINGMIYSFIEEEVELIKINRKQHEVNDED